MTQRTKKILKIIAAALVIIFIGLLIYYFFFKEKQPKIQPTGQEGFPPITEEGAAGAKPRLIALTEETVLGANLTPDNKINYLAWDGNIKQIDFNGENDQSLGFIAAERIGQVVFSSDGQKIAVNHTLSSGAKRILIYNLASRTLKALPENSIFVVFSPKADEDRLIYGLLEGLSTRLISTNISGTQTQTISSLKIPDLDPEWTHPDFLTLKTKPSGLAYGLLYTLNLKTKKMNRLLGNVYGLTAKFSPSHAKTLYSQTSTNGFDYNLAVLNLANNQNANLDILSLPEKCVFSKNDRKLWCAAINTESDYVMPDDYYKGLIESSGDDLVSIDLITRKQEKIISANNMNAHDLFLSPDETYLFFINKTDGRLYRLTL